MWMDGYLVLCFTVIVINVSFNNVESGPVYRMEIDTSQHKMKVHEELKDDYMRKRQEILLTEQHERVGGQLVLSVDELRVDSVLMKAKQAEINNSLIEGHPFAPSLNFITAKPMIEQSAVFKMIKKMPKGGILHIHDVSMTDINWLVKNVTYRDHCYMCYDVNKSISFKFFQTPPSNPGCPWRLVRDFRTESGNASQFDHTLYESMIMTEKTFSQDINTVWKRFLEVLGRATGLIIYKPVFIDYYYEALKEFYDDNVQYVEVRALLSKVYELDGSTHDVAYTMELYKNTTDMFKAHYPGFTGAKVIRTNIRVFPPADILADVKESIQFMQQFPDFFAGYDLVGQEDPGEPLLHYLDELQYPSKQSPPVKLPYFFHAGETNWQGTKVDDNLIDAILLNTSRIGHGYALTKHPEVMKLVKQRGIAIEINPISNQVLKLVDDIRNHPGAGLIADGYPVTISCDDPSVWGATGLSYDFYEAFMALTGETDGLQVLKQLAMNSLIVSFSSIPEEYTDEKRTVRTLIRRRVTRRLIWVHTGRKRITTVVLSKLRVKYSAMNDAEKVLALKDWEKKWTAFIQNV